MWARHVFSALFLAAFLGVGETGSAQVDQGRLASQILGADQVAQGRAVALAGDIPPAEVGPELRSALIRLLEQYNALEERAAGSGGTLDQYMNPESSLNLVIVVSRLREPGSMPALVGALGHGWAVIDALLSFGEAAIQSVLGVVRSPASRAAAVDDGLMFLSRIAAGESGVVVTEELRASLGSAQRCV